MYFLEESLQNTTSVLVAVFAGFHNVSIYYWSLCRQVTAKRWEKWYWREDRIFTFFSNLSKLTKLHSQQMSFASSPMFQKTNLRNFWENSRSCICGLKSVTHFSHWAANDFLNKKLLELLNESSRFFSSLVNNFQLVPVLNCSNNKMTM